MNLKNYTSEVPASTSMARIEDLLVEAGATDISKKYKDGICNAITFRMEVDNIPLFFQLPANVEACYRVMYSEIKRPREDTAKRIRDQAARTAWKIIHEWVEVQLSMIRLEQAQAIQIFLPYVYDQSRNETFFDRIAKNNFKQLTNG